MEGESTSYDFFRDETGVRLQDHIPTSYSDMTQEGLLEQEGDGLDINAEVQRRRAREAEIARQEYMLGLGRTDSVETGKLIALIKRARFETRPRSSIITALMGEKPYAPKLYPRPFMRFILGNEPSAPDL